MQRIILICLLLSGCATTPELIGSAGYTEGVLDSKVFDAKPTDSAEVKEVKKTAKTVTVSAQKQNEELRALYEEKIKIIKADAAADVKAAQALAEIANKRVNKLEKALKIWKIIGGVGAVALLALIIVIFLGVRMK